MKIVHFVEAYGGGVYTYVTDLIIYLKNRLDISNKDEIHLIYSNNRVEFDQDLFESQIPSEIHLHLIPMQRSINPLNDWNTMKQSREILKKIKPDILHLHSSKASVIGRMAAFNIVNRKKIFYSPHGYAFVEYGLSTIKKTVYYSIEKMMQIAFGGTTVASGDTEFLEAQKIGNAFLIRNGISFNNDNLPKQNIKTKKFTIGTVGRLLPQKNPALFNEIALKLPHINFVWIGNGNLDYLITAPNITVTGWVKTREELLSLINEFDIYMQTSLWEGLPISILEAMALNKPIFATNVIGNKDTIEEGINGYLFDNADQAIEKITTIEKDEELKIKMGKNS